MLPGRAKIVVCACAAATAAVWWNVMYLQPVTRADMKARNTRLGEIQPRAPSLTERIETALSRAGELTTPQNEPVGADKQASQPQPDPDTVRAIQRELAQRGYAPGLTDGRVMPVTRAAVMAYEYDHGMPLTGEPSEDLFKAMLFGQPPAVGAAAHRQPIGEAVNIIRTVQQSLVALGFPIASVDGRLSKETSLAIRKFEAQQSLPQTGRVSGLLYVRLTEAAAKQQRKAMTN
jgi:peptidoglycan hydrolase-like protein with peptidoglycan-binding domain